MYHQTKIGQVACQDGSYSTQNFDICATSKSNFEKLAGNPRLQCQFAMDEDQFLFFEKHISLSTLYHVLSIVVPFCGIHPTEN